MTNLTEQFKATIAKSSVEGEYDTDWTDCYNRTCVDLQLLYDKKFCKSTCKISAANAAIIALSGYKGKCRLATNPESCLKSLNRGVNKYRSIVAKERDKLTAFRAKAAEFRRNSAVAG
jgi:hypothetical protein